jgi:hypothetical protein
MRFCGIAAPLRRAIVLVLLSMVVSSLAGCGGSASNSAPKVGGAKVDPEVEAQNRAAIETYNKEKGAK